MTKKNKKKNKRYRTQTSMMRSNNANGKSNSRPNSGGSNNVTPAVASPATQRTPLSPAAAAAPTIPKAMTSPTKPKPADSIAAAVDKMIDESSSLPSASNNANVQLTMPMYNLPNLVNRISTTSNGDADGGGSTQSSSSSNSSYSIPPLAKRDDSSSSSSGSSSAGYYSDGNGNSSNIANTTVDIPAVVAAAFDATTNNKHNAKGEEDGVPKTVRYESSSSSSSSEDGDESLSDDEELSEDEDYVNLDIDEEEEDSMNSGMPALVQRDESSQSSNESTDSMPQLVNRSNNEKQQHSTTPTATPSPNKTAAAKKKKRKKKKKSTGSSGKATTTTTEPTTSSESPSGEQSKTNNETTAATSKSSMDMTAVRELLQKFNMTDQDEMALYYALTNSPHVSVGSVTGSKRMERQFLLELAHDNFHKLYQSQACVEGDISYHYEDISHTIPKPTFVVKMREPATVKSVLDTLFYFNKDTGNDTNEILWTLLDDTVTAHILKGALSRNPLSSSVESLKWFEDNASDALEAFVSQGSGVRKEDVSALLETGVTVSCKSVAALFKSLPIGRGHGFNNAIARTLCEKSTLVMQNKNEYKMVMDAVSETLGKAGKGMVIDALKQASTEMHNSKNKARSPEKAAAEALVKTAPKKEPTTKESLKAMKAQEEAEKKLAALKLKTHKITSALQWYTQLLDDLNITAAASIDSSDSEGVFDEEKKCDDEDIIEVSTTKIMRPKNVLTQDQVEQALSNCDSEELLSQVEIGIDLMEFDGMSTWCVDITEQAHKWFRRHLKKDRALCERIIRRLTLLSTGRWPYVLCKPLKSRQLGSTGKKITLYETKIDSASRIIWEVALAFSPRRSRMDEGGVQYFCEQVIRVWDIVLDHDNLSDAIERTVDRIEKSHLRGEECAIYAEIDKSNIVVPAKEESEDSPVGVNIIPRVFAMSNEVANALDREHTPKGRSRHFHPASDDPRQYTLLKFYELNAGAIKILLDGQDGSCDLPFTPGPKEHEIIHHKSDPHRSILLMGRSGTGKTTCLVFRMWALYAEYIDGQHGARPRQLFVTKNDILCSEVKRSFNNMGLAWRNRTDANGITSTETVGAEDEKPKFLTSMEWLDALDIELPGDSFFHKTELKKRLDNRKNKDSVTKGIEALLDSKETEEDESSTAVALRQEITFTIFRKLWRKFRGGSNLDCLVVLREIRSFIKGSVAALQIGREDRSLPQHRFLSLEEYISLPRKQSRLDEIQRREVYGLYLKYESLKKEGNYYDEADLVYNIAGRVAALDRGTMEKMVAAGSGLLPIDSLFVDEVQDFTQAELFILAKLCRDPNNLFLAGDTAQSIAIGVDFRFTDVRQIFYNSFGGIEPKLLQLTHNFRSHAGILRLAACVVELLYHFFGNSLDKLPPDLGLFSGPKPMIMDVGSTQELVLMLQGAKRASRIEFGAHQVVIVRNEEAKKSLPDEFGIDPDWVMTVQESKGLEFDDVLLYNFFTDSPAEDLWRVVSSYSEEDIAAYYANATVSGSGVEKYDWDSPLLTETRHLNFSADEHKILETELKMLYTAVTRARVNIFIAETDTESSRPMFNYFQRRAVVDIVSQGTTDEEGSSSVRVFGAKNTIEDWRNRGEYYLRNAEGERQIGCLRLAAKCFDKAGEPQRRDYALAFLSFTEIEQQDPAKLRGKHGVGLRQKLYSITEQLLGARDVGFLKAAGLCLLRTGEQEEYTAQLFELYARLCYTQRIVDEKGNVVLPLAPSEHEKKYFSYAAKLFAKCSQERSVKFDLALSAFRNYICAGMYEASAELLQSEALPIQDHASFKELYQLCLPSSPMDPTASFRKDFKTRSDKCSCVINAVKQIVSQL